MRLGGTLMVQASNAVIGQAKAVAAKVLGVPDAEVAFDDGLFQTPKSNRRLTIYDVAQALDADPALAPAKLHAKATFTGRIPAYPTGCAICEVEIDPDTGAIAVVRYGSIDDAGQPINPLILHGQVHGGIVQGLGQALLEDVVYAEDSGQVLTGSFMDYGIPRAHHAPSFDIELTEDPTKGNPLRVKGGGEAGITPALAVVMNAVMDALKDYGVEHMDMPATPHRIWSTIQRATAASPA
jgi:carbon-monoxide dehydrogenase large subunit